MLKPAVASLVLVLAAVTGCADAAVDASTADNTHDAARVSLGAAQLRVRVAGDVSSQREVRVRVILPRSLKRVPGRIAVRVDGLVAAVKRLAAGHAQRHRLVVPAMAPGTHSVRAAFRMGEGRVLRAPVTQVVSHAGCAWKPRSCGYPDATNTGPKPGTALRSVPGEIRSGPGWHYDSRGWIVVDGNGAVVEGIHSVGAEIDVQASNVTIRNNVLEVSGEGWAVALRSGSNITIEHNEIHGSNTGSGRLMVGIKDIYGTVSGVRAVANHIWHVSTGIQLDSGLVADNYIVDFGFVSGDHTNGFTSNGGDSPLEIRHNTIFNQLSQTDAISLFQDFEVQANRQILGNLIAGGGYTIYAGANPGKESTATNIRVIGNRVSRHLFPRGGYYGPATAYTDGGGNVWSGNVWDETGRTIKAP